MTGPRAIVEIMSRLDGLEIDEQARQAVRNLVVEIGIAHGIKEIERCEQLSFIRRMLAARISRQTIRDRLMARYPISRRQAYRLLGEGLQLCQNPRDFGTRPEDN
jgi:hypothetical protein